MLRPTLFLSVVITLPFLFSCKGNKTASEHADIIGIDSSRYIRIPDADSLLPGWRTDNSVVNHWIGDPDNLHPTNGRTASRSWILSLTHNYLMRLDPVSMEVVPDLATAQPEISANKLEFTYSIRPDARWDDGKPVTAADVAFTLKVNKCPLTDNPNARSETENLMDIRLYPDDPQKLTLIMHHEYLLNIAFLATFAIMERDFHDRDQVMDGVSFAQLEDPAWLENPPADVVAFMQEFNDGKYGNDPSLYNGSGPYKVVTWNRHADLILDKKPNHWTDQIKDPKVFQKEKNDRIVFLEIKDDNAQMLELKSQTIDATVWLSTQSMLALEADENFKRNYNYRYTDNYSFNYLGVNTQPDGIRHPKIFDSKEVRQAMTYLVPIEDIVHVIYNDRATVWPAFLSPYKNGFNDTLKPYYHDLNKAVSLLENAGWTDTDGDGIRDKMVDGKKTDMRFELLYSHAGAWIDQMAGMIREAFLAGGIDVKVMVMDLPALSQKVSSHDFDAYLGAWGTNSLPDDYTALWHTSSYAGGGPNFCGFGNTYTDALIDSMNLVVDESVRAPMIRELQAIVHDEAPYIMYLSASRKNVIHKRLGNQIMTFERPGNMVNYLQVIGHGMQELQ